MQSSHESTGSARFVDTHLHLDLDVFANRETEVLADAADAGVRAWINVGFEPQRWASTIALAEAHRGMRHMLGVHPGSVHAWTPAVADQLRALVTGSHARAIGEIGIDLFRGETNLRAQRTAFDQQLDIAVELNLPVVIHMRAAEHDVLDLLSGRKVLPRLVFHSFDGTPTLRDFILEHNAFVGVGGLATRSGSDGLREVLRTIPLARMILETDAPYLSPKGTRGRYNVPANIPVVARALASLTSVTLDEIAATTTANAEIVFGKLEYA